MYLSSLSDVDCACRQFTNEGLFLSSTAEIVDDVASRRAITRESGEVIIDEAFGLYVLPNPLERYKSGSDQMTPRRARYEKYGSVQLTMLLPPILIAISRWRMLIMPRAYADHASEYKSQHDTELHTTKPPK